MNERARERIMRANAAALTDAELDIYIGEAQRMLQRHDPAKWVAAQQRRQADADAMQAKLDEFVVESETRGIRVRRGPGGGQGGGQGGGGGRP